MLLAALCLFSSCQEVIELNLNSASSILVIEGNIFDRKMPPYHQCEVNLSRTVNYNGSNFFPPVLDAKVTISDDAGNSEKLSSINGGYFTDNLKVVVGRKYNLTVLVDGKTYSASSTMPRAVEIDSLYFRSFFGTTKFVTIDFTGPVRTENYYRFVQFVNNKRITGFSYLSQNLPEVLTTSYSFVSMIQRGDSLYKKGDSISVWLETIDKGAYDFFRTAGSYSGQSASLANPVSNISNGALGYFNACSVRKSKKILIP